MADLVAVNAAQYCGAVAVSDAFEPGRHFRCHIEPTCFEHERHDGKPREQVPGRSRRRFPQSVMSRQVAVTGYEIGQSRGQQLEMQRLLGRDLYPIVVE